MGRRERERERETDRHRCEINIGHSLLYVPGLGVKPATFQSMGHRFNQLSHISQGLLTYFKLYKYYTNTFL